MVRRVGFVLAGWLALTVASCGREERAPMLAGGREVKSWLETLKDGDPKKRRVAVLKLGNVGDADPAAAVGLADALLDADSQVRRDAVLAVAKLARPGATMIERLRRISSGDPDPRARELATKALIRFGAAAG